MGEFTKLVEQTLAEETTSELQFIKDWFDGKKTIGDTHGEMSIDRSMSYGKGGEVLLLGMKVLADIDKVEKEVITSRGVQLKDSNKWRMEIKKIAKEKGFKIGKS
jgi:hypothetical protein